MPLVRFLSPLDVRVHPCPPPGVSGERCYQLQAPLVVQIGSELVEVPTAFFSDGGSIPAFLWSLLGIHPMTPKFCRPFFTHDFLFLVGYKGDRKLCDQVLRDGALAEGADPDEVRNVYTGVRIGSWKAWNDYRKKSAYELQKNINSLRAGEPMFRLTAANWHRNLDGLS